MRATALKYAMSVGLGGMLALGAATGFGQVRTETDAASQVTQYCVPTHDNPDSHRFYCDKEDGWSGPTGAAAFACFMEGIGQGAFAACHRAASTAQDCHGRSRSNH